MVKQRMDQTPGSAPGEIRFRVALRVGTLALLALVAVLCSGCWETAAWSPDGRYLLYVRGADERAWLWDTVEQRATPINYNHTVVSCAFARRSTEMLLLVEGANNTGSQGDYDLHWFDSATSSWCELVKKTDPSQYAVSPDGGLLYYRVENKEASRYELWQLNLDDRKTRRLIYSSPHELAYPCVSPDGGRLAFAEAMDDVVIGLCWVKTGAQSKTPREMDGASESATVFAKLTKGDLGRLCWVDQKHLVGVWRSEDAKGEPNNDWGALMLFALSGGKPKPLCEHVSPLNIFPVPKQHAVLVTAACKNLEQDPQFNWPSTTQIASVDIRSGKKTVLTDDPMGAGMAVCDPEGKRVAYMNLGTSNSDEMMGGLYQILNRSTDETSVVWADEEERLLSAAQRFEDGHDAPQALATYDDLFRRFPETRFASPAHYGRALIYLTGPSPDLEKAYAELKSAGQGTLSEQTRALVWRKEDQVAADPAGDAIRSYGSDAAKEAFGFETDPTRDLLGLWARWSPKKLYLRIDFNSPQDLDGLTFKDVIVLFDYDSPEQGYRSITPLVQWDRGAECEVVLHHWFPEGSKSQYDVEILDAQGEVRSRFAASGFSPPAYPLFNVVETFSDKGTGAVVLELDREVLKIDKTAKVYVQVCTVKGGIESHRAVERPRENPADGKPACDIADAFGPENTRARIDADLAQGKAPVIRGYAGLLTQEGAGKPAP